VFEWFEVIDSWLLGCLSGFRAILGGYWGV